MTILSISLNNHESRIAVLENIKLNYVEKVLWTGNILWNTPGNKIVLQEPYLKFDLLFTTGCYSNGMWYHITPVSQLTDTPQSGTYRSLQHSPDVCWVPFTTTDFKTLINPLSRQSVPLSVLKIIGVKFAKVILYNFSYIIIHLIFAPLSYLLTRRCKSR